MRSPERGSPVWVLKAFPSAVMMLLVAAVGTAAGTAVFEPEGAFGAAIVVVVAVSNCSHGGGGMQQVMAGVDEAPAEAPGRERVQGSVA